MSQLHVSRRALLGASALSSLGFLLRPSAAWAQPAKPAEGLANSPVLLCVFLRGAADGLNIVVPHGEAEYYRLRPGIAVRPPSESGGALDLDGRFGLHPKLAPLKAAWDAKSWRSSLPSARRTPRARISKRRTTWRRQQSATARRRAVGWPTTLRCARPRVRRCCERWRCRHARRWRCAATATPWWRPA